MKLIIDIGEYEYEEIKKDAEKFRSKGMVVPYLYKVIESGTPLDKYKSESEQEPKTGHWITGRSIYHDVEMYRCSECKNWSPYKLEKCPNCHVRMVTESEDK